ncbi:hypothetical protein B0H13DRAFT_1911025 [Mycena leptocephala]|nr:hypothetical protein B0H13DRAFT_1911025 [Mycena leptocephala]
MDSKTPLQFEDLPAPASHTDSSRPKHCKKRRVFRLLGFSALLLWVGARYLRVDSPMAFHHLDTPWPIPSDMSVDHCEPWSNNGETDPDISEDFPYSADANFELPVSADTLFLISRSIQHRHVFSTGRVNYLQSEEVSDSIKVDITAFFWRQEYLDASKACLLTRDNDQTGVGIFTKWEGERRREEHQKLRFDVTVTFPRTEDGSALAINRFLADLPIFSQTFADMSSVAFDKLYLKSALAAIRAESLYASNATIRTSLGPIKIQSLVATDAHVTTSMGPIEGTFNASGSLTLTTSNGPINVDVNLSNDDDDAAKLRMHTSNGYIQGNINLLSKDAGTFDITARTANGRLGLAVLSAPVNSNITLHATTALGSADVYLPPTYEGSFRAHTSLSSIDVKVDDEVEDPAGEGRTRRTEFDQVRRGMSTGRVGWSDEGMDRGSVDVRTSMAGVRLEF